MKIPILKGVYVDETTEFRTKYPRNMMPVPHNSGIDNSYLRPADGIVDFGTTGPGLDRGGINWQGVCYRVMGSKLVSVNAAGAVTIIGDVGGTSSQVKMDYSFDYLGIISDGQFWLYDGLTLQQNVDPDLGTVIDFIYVDGYFLLTDGAFLIVTELGNPFSVNPLKYGSSEVDPDPITGLLKIRNEPYAINRHTIEVFRNIGGENFPFQRVEGTRIDKGAIGTFGKSYFLGTVAFLGGGRNESPAIWIGLNADTQKISTREVDTILQTYTEAQLANVVLEERVDKSHQHLWVRLPDKTLVFDRTASNVLQTPIWFILSSALVGDSQYLGRNLVWCYDKWLVADNTDRLGYLSNEISTQFGQTIGWEFQTLFVFNGGRGAVIHELELIGLPGRIPLGVNPTICTCYTLDGATYSNEKAIYAGKQGDRSKRLVWYRQGGMENYRSQRFRGTSDAHLTFARLEAQMEALRY